MGSGNFVNQRTDDIQHFFDHLDQAFETGGYIERTVGIVTLIGELHAYSPSLALGETSGWAHVRVLAEQSNGCIVEKEAHPGDLWNTVIGYDQSFHTLAETAGRQKHMFQTLEPAEGYTLEEKRIAYEKADFPLDIRTVAAMEVAMALRLINSDFLLEYIIININEQTGNNFSKADLMAITMLAKEIVEHHRQDLEFLDASLRENIMQDRLTASISKDDKVLVVVGAMHTQGIENSLKNPRYRTPLDSSKSRELGRMLIDFSESTSEEFLEEKYGLAVKEDNQPLVE